MDNESVINKIKGLLSKTVDNGCTVEEAAASFAVAQKFLEKFRLTLADVESYEVDEPIENFGDMSGEWTERLSDWKSSLANALAINNFCRVYLWTSYVGRKQSRKSVKIIGRKSDVEITNYLFVFMSNEIERLCKIEQKRTGGYGKTWSNSFKLGAVAAISAKLATAKKEARLGAASNSIIKLDTRQKLVDDALARMDLKTGALQKRNLTEDAYFTGYRAGNNIDAKKAVAGKGVKQLNGK